MKQFTRARLTSLVAALLLMLFASGVAAQTAIDPRTAEFAPSTDHSRIGPNGAPLVQGYQIEFYLQGAAQPFQSASLGKPAPGPDGLIRVDLSAIFLGWPLPGTVYTSTVAAAGPGGSTRSTPSNPFTFSAPAPPPGPCSYVVSPTVLNVAATAASSSIGVTTAAGCSWVAVSNDSWLTITNGAGGSGSGTVALSIAVNPGTSPRAGTLLVAGQAVTVIQAAASSPACAFTVAPNVLNPAANGGSASVTVNTTAGCAWTALSNDSWLTITDGGSGSGAGTVAFSIAANPGTSPRAGTLVVAGQTVTVIQAAASSPTCAFTVSPTTVTAAASGGAQTSSVTTASGCSWIATSNASWLAISAGGSGVGSGSVAYDVAVNPAAASRTGTLTIAGRTVTVTQQAASTNSGPPPPGNVRVLP